MSAVNFFDYFPWIQRAIQHHFQLTSSPEETLIDICHKLKIDVDDIDSIAPELFRTFWTDEYKLIFEDIPKDCLLIAKEIVFKFQLFKNGIFDAKNEVKNFDFFPDNARYAINCSNIYGRELKGLDVIDYYRGEKATIPFINGPIVSEYRSPSFEIYPIDSKYVLLIEQLKMNGKLYLIYTDYVLRSCTVISQVVLRLPINYQSIFIFDPVDRRKFVILSSLEDVRRGRNDPTSLITIKNDQINVQNNANTLRSSFKAFGHKFTNGKLCGFKIKKCPSYWEMDMNEVDQIITKFHFDEIPDSLNLLEYGRLEYRWSTDDVCYVGVTNMADDIRTFIYAFNVETQACVQINFNCMIIGQIHVDVDHNLTVQADKTIYRLPQRKPESFKNIAWFTIRRLTQFHSNPIYENAVKQMVSNTEFQLFFGL